jgi:hypothetical protein
MSKKDELLSAIKAESYSGFILKGVFVHHGDFYYPTKVCLLAAKDKEANTRYFDYGDFLFVEDGFSIEKTIEIIQKLGEAFECAFSSYSVKIPRGYFRTLEEDPSKIAQEYHGYAFLDDIERELLKEKRSYPKSDYRQWPTEVYIFYFEYQNEINLFRSRLADRPFPFKKDLPVFPGYYEALESWFGKELRYLHEGQLVFYIPRHQARIRNVTFAKDMFAISIEEGSCPKREIAAKYFIGYENLSDDFGELAFDEENRIILKDKVLKFYIVLFNKKSGIPIDYRNYNFGYIYNRDFDIEYDEGNIEHWLAEGENESVEYKLSIDEKNPKEFIESVCAFSNTHGGRVILGVDDKANVKGLDKEQVSKYKVQIPDLIRQWIEPQTKLHIKTSEARGKNLIIVSVQKGDNPPYNYKDHGVYIRANATDRIATREELLQLQTGKNIQRLFNGR